MKKRRKLLIIGALDFKNMDSGGQLVKTRELYYLFTENKYFDSVQYLDTCDWKKTFFYKIFILLYRMIKSNYIIMLPAHNGLKFFSRFIPLFKKNKKIYYDVIGGWLYDKAKNNNHLVKKLKLFDGIFVETSSMKAGLNQLGIKNVYVIPNFKKIEYVEEESYSFTYPLKLCTFSRVVKEKGIGEAIRAVVSVNNQIGYEAFSLDIYGQIDELYANDFNQLMRNSPEYIKYCGLVETKRSSNVLKNYYMLLFPTKFYTEGIPGTFIDAYVAGLPVITALWMNCSDVFIEEENGFGYAFDDENGLQKCLMKAYIQKEKVVSMRKKCKEKAIMFSRENAFEKLTKIIE